MNGRDSFLICRPSFYHLLLHSPPLNQNRFSQFRFSKTMSLGKRSRAPIRKTPSMAEITFDLGGAATADPFPTFPINTLNSGFQKPPSPRNYRRNSFDLQDNNNRNINFLAACSLCSQPLVPGRDIYMYRGDRGFCSDECRKKQMKQDERMEKCSLAAKKAAAAVAVVANSAAVPTQISGKGETVAAS